MLAAAAVVAEEKAGNISKHYLLHSFVLFGKRSAKLSFFPRGAAPERSPPENKARVLAWLEF